MTSTSVETGGSEAAAERPKRLTLSQIVEALMIRPGEHSTVKLARNARGDTQIEVAVRAGAPGAETLEDAARQARELYDELCARYPAAAAAE